MILNDFDSSKNAIIDPDFMIEKIEDFPEVTISCFSTPLFSSILENLDHSVIGYTHTAGSVERVYEVEYCGEKFAFYRSCVGEPRCIMDYENIMAMGSKRLILFGNCGVLDRNIEDYGIIIPTAAIRDEGCSYHYAPASDTIEVNTKYRDLFKEVLNENGYSWTEGITWTTDAFFRETMNKVEKRKEQGAVCVEMECAGMQALCNFRKTDFFQFLYAGDNLDSSVWQPRSIAGRSRLSEKIGIATLAFELGLRIKKSVTLDNKHST